MSNGQSFSYIQPTVVMPSNLNIGDSWAFDLSAGDYNDGSWTATMTFASGAARLAQDATLTNTVFYWLFTSAETATMPAGTLAYTIMMSRAPERYTTQEGMIQALPDITQEGAIVPTQTVLQQDLTLVDALIQQLLSSRTQRVMFAGKEYELWQIKDLWAIRNDIAMRAQAEAAALAGNSRHRIIIPVFKNPWGGPYPSYPYYPYGGP
jgi:hypothetical protein